MTKCSRTFKTPDLVTGSKSALARRNAILKKQASNPVISKNIYKSFTAQDVIQKQHEIRKRKMKQRVANKKKLSNALIMISDFSLSLKASNELERLRTAMCEQKRRTKSSV